MPIYAYRCADCGFAQDIMQKMSDPLLTVCPSCGKSEFKKQVTAAGFQLKGSGWYATDFKSSGTSAPTGPGITKAEQTKSESDGSTESATTSTTPVDSSKAKNASSDSASSSPTK